LSEVLTDPYRFAVAGFDKSGILVYYQFCESSGDLINKATIANGFADGLGDSQDGGVGSGVDYSVEGIIDDAYDFDATSNGRVTLSTDIITGTGAFSINIWLYHTAQSGNDTVVQGDGQTLIQYQSATDAYQGGQDPRLTSTTDIPLNTWNMVTYTRDASNNAKLYIDGTEEATGSNSTSINSGTWTIGGIAPSYVEMWNGRVDELLIANIELSSDQVTELYNGGAALNLLA